MEPVTEFTQKTVAEGFLNNQLFIVLSHSFVDESPDFLELRDGQRLQRLLGQLGQLLGYRLRKCVIVTDWILFLGIKMVLFTRFDSQLLDKEAWCRFLPPEYVGGLVTNTCLNFKKSLKISFIIGCNQNDIVRLLLVYTNVVLAAVFSSLIETHSKELKKHFPTSTSIVKGFCRCA